MKESRVCLLVMSREGANVSKLIWMLDDEFNSYEIELEILQKSGDELVVSNSTSFKKDFPRYAPNASGILLQVSFPLADEVIRKLTSCKKISVTGGDKIT